METRFTEKEIQDLVKYINKIPTEYGMNLLVFIQNVYKRNVEESNKKPDIVEKIKKEKNVEKAT